MNVIVRCPRCGELITVAVRNLEWIRCPRCHYSVKVARNIVGQVSTFRGGK